MARFVEYIPKQGRIIRQRLRRFLAIGNGCYLDIGNGKCVDVGIRTKALRTGNNSFLAVGNGKILTIS